MGTGNSLVAAVIARLEAAADAASEAVLEVSSKTKDGAAAGGAPVPNPASCTFVAAVVEQDLLVVGSVGDSRAYWLPDAGAATALTLDDSFAQEQIAAGVPRDRPRRVLSRTPSLDGSGSTRRTTVRRQPT